MHAATASSTDVSIVTEPAATNPMQDEQDKIQQRLNAAETTHTEYEEKITAPGSFHRGTSRHAEGN